MDMPSYSIITNSSLNYKPVLGRLLILVAVFVYIFGVCMTPVFADDNATITFNPIDSYASGESINISGTTSLEKCKQIGIEILPKKYWDMVRSYAKEDSSGRVVFNPVASTKENFHPSGIKLVRFNADGTQATQIMDLPEDHVLVTVSVEKGGQKEKNWSVLIEKNDYGTPLSPGTYHVNIWDATNQKNDYDNPMPNGWDIATQKIYPCTGRINLWDTANKRDLFYAELVIR